VLTGWIPLRRELPLEGQPLEGQPLEGQPLEGLTPLEALTLTPPEGRPPGAFGQRVRHSRALVLGP
jgi:hypothetical protein